MSDQFKDKYVLGEGYPWANGTEDYKEITLKNVALAGLNIVLNFPEELWSKKVPKYRLVLERVEE